MPLRCHVGCPLLGVWRMRRHKEELLLAKISYQELRCYHPDQKEPAFTPWTNIVIAPATPEISSISNPVDRYSALVNSKISKEVVRLYTFDPVDSSFTICMLKSTFDRLSADTALALHSQMKSQTNTLVRSEMTIAHVFKETNQPEQLLLSEIF